MWPFKHIPSKGELEERLERLERRFLGLVEEWDDAFDRIRRAENRIKEKRAKLESETVAAEPEENGVQISSGTERPLSPSQARLQQSILKLRRMQ